MKPLHQMTLAVFSLALFTSCGKKDAAAPSPDFPAYYENYNLTGESMQSNAEGEVRACSTGNVKSTTLQEYCYNLANDKLNNHCAEEERKYEYRTARCDKVVVDEFPTMDYRVQGYFDERHFHWPNIEFENAEEHIISRHSTGSMVTIENSGHNVPFNELQSRLRKQQDSKISHADLPINGKETLRVEFNNSGKKIDLTVSKGSMMMVRGVSPYLDKEFNYHFGIDQVQYHPFYHEKLAREQQSYQINCQGKVLESKNHGVIERIQYSEEFSPDNIGQEVNFQPFSKLKGDIKVPFAFSLELASTGSKNYIKTRINLWRLNQSEGEFSFENEFQFSRYFSLKYRHGVDDATFSDISITCEFLPINR